MKKFANVQGLKQEIDAYEAHFTGAPLLIGIDSNRDYTALLGLLKDDFWKTDFADEQCMQHGFST